MSRNGKNGLSLLGKISRSFFCRNEWAFRSLYNGLSCTHLEKNQTSRVDELREHGITRWPGLFSDEGFLEEARSLLVETCRKSRSTLERQAQRRFTDPENGWIYSGGIRKDGRTRTSFPQSANLPGPIRQVMQHAGLLEIVSGYYGVPASASYVLAERLEPAEEGDFWHMDRICDQAKAMILLTDVDRNAGPMRYKTGTHRRSADTFVHQVFRNGVDYGYPPAPLVERLPGNIDYATGKAGDCFLFDTVGIHSGTRCHIGHRDVLVVCFCAPTRKNRVL